MADLQHVQELAERYAQLKVRVMDVDDKYSIEFVEPKLDMPDSLNLQKLEYTPKTDEELEVMAEEAVAAIIISKQRAIERSYSSKLKSLNVKSDKLTLTLSKAVSSTSEDYAKKKEAVRLKLINNGLVFSTVGNKYNTLLSEEHSSSIKKIVDYGERERGLINQEQKNAEEVYNESCVSLDKERQARIAEKIQKLKEAEENLRLSIEKYNNSLEEKEQKYQASRAKAYENARRAAYNRAYNNAKLYLEMGESGYRRLVQQEKYAVCQDFFYPMSKEDAKTILSFDSFLRNHLGTYYDTLVDWINHTLI